MCLVVLLELLKLLVFVHILFLCFHYVLVTNKIIIIIIRLFYPCVSA